METAAYALLTAREIDAFKNIVGDGLRAGK